MKNEQKKPGSRKNRDILVFPRGRPLVRAVNKAERPRFPSRAGLPDSFDLRIQVILEEDRAAGVHLIREDRQVTASHPGRWEDERFQERDGVEGLAELLGRCGPRAFRPLTRQFLVVGRDQLLLRRIAEIGDVIGLTCRLISTHEPLGLERGAFGSPRRAPTS